jgi:hypothetical protein
MHVHLAQSSKEMHMNPDMCGLSNAKPYAGMQSCITQSICNFQVHTDRLLSQLNNVFPWIKLKFC